MQRLFMFVCALAGAIGFSSTPMSTPMPPEPEDMCGCMLALAAGDKLDACIAACSKEGDLDPEYPYWVGPVEFGAYQDILPGPALLNELGGQVWMRLHKDRTAAKFMWTLTGFDTVPNADKLLPLKSAHLHQGDPTGYNGKAYAGGPLLVTILGKGDSGIPCVYAPSTQEGYEGMLPFVPGIPAMCTTQCIDPSSAPCVHEDEQAEGMCICQDEPLVKAHSCQGGCNGDARKASFQAPARVCDLGIDERPGDPYEAQGVWWSGKNSVELSGNQSDYDYSPHSIFISENYDNLCSEHLGYLDELVLAHGATSYFALHTNLEAMGVSLGMVTGILLAPFIGGVTPCKIFGGDIDCYDLAQGDAELPTVVPATVEYAGGSI